MLQFEQQYLDALPSAQMYEKSYMHRDTLTYVVVSTALAVLRCTNQEQASTNSLTLATVTAVTTALVFILIATLRDALCNDPQQQYQKKQSYAPEAPDHSMRALYPAPAVISCTAAARSRTAATMYGPQQQQ